MHLCIVIFFVAIFAACAAQERTQEHALVGDLRALRDKLEKQKVMGQVMMMLGNLIDCETIDEEDLALKCRELHSQKEAREAKHESLTNDIKIIDVLIRMMVEEYPLDSQKLRDPPSPPVGRGSGYYKLWEDVEDDDDDEDEDEDDDEDDQLWLKSQVSSM